MPPTNFYNNQICKDSWHQAEVGGSHQLKLSRLIFDRKTLAEVGGSPRLKAIWEIIGVVSVM